LTAPLSRVGLALVIAVLAAPIARSQGAALPAALDSYVTKYLQLTAAERSRLLAGQPVTRIMEADPAREVAVFGAVWVNAPAARYVAAVKDIENFERGPGFRVTKKVSSPPVLDDFAEMDLPDDDVADLQRCRVGACELKLSEGALTRLRQEIDWTRPTARADAERLARRLALEYVTGYLEGGNANLAAYRDARRPTFVGQEFQSMIERMPSLTEYLPQVKDYLLNYPKATLPNAHSFIYWQETRFGLKPTIRINHLVVSEQPNGTVIASKMLYASHYFWTALELRVLVPDPSRGRGFWFVTVNRSRSDGLSGFVGTLIRGRVRSEAERGMQSALQFTKSMLEQAGG
jgi:hypothetical protein